LASVPLHNSKKASEPPAIARPRALIVLTRKPWLAILILAVVAGAALRFADLGSNEMSADEAATWAAAAAPSVAQVIALQKKLNAGKLAVHDVLLHGWIAMFGDGIRALRSLSALLGTIAIVLVFWVARELLTPACDCAAAGDTVKRGADLAAAIAALIFAVNLVTIKYSRELRMYPLMLSLLLAQVGFFIRASRRGGFVNYVAAGMLADAAIATNLSATLIFGTEGLWLLCLLARSGFRPLASESRRAWKVAIALALAGAAFAPVLLEEWRTGSAAVGRGVLGWIQRPPLWEPFALFNKATGTFAFPVLAALAAYGAIRGWRVARDAAAFALVWMWTPVIVLMIVSYAVAPALAERYVLSCFVPMFFLAALGICELGSSRTLGLALAAAAALSIGHVYSFMRKPHDIQWREATAIALKNLAPGATLSTRPAYAVEVVRYYLPPAERERAQRGGDPAIVLVEERGRGAAPHTAVNQKFPVTIARLRGVAVLKR